MGDKCAVCSEEEEFLPCRLFLRASGHWLWFWVDRIAEVGGDRVLWDMAQEYRNWVV
jgi:hypothetical protein